MQQPPQAGSFGGRAGRRERPAPDPRAWPPVPGAGGRARPGAARRARGRPGGARCRGRCGVNAPAAWQAPFISMSTSSAPTSSRTAPAACARVSSASSTPDHLDVRGADLRIGQERVGDRLEQGAVDLLGARHRLQEREQRRTRIGSSSSSRPRGHRLRHPLAARWPRSAPPWRRSCETACRVPRRRAGRSPPRPRRAPVPGRAPARRRAAARGCARRRRADGALPGPWGCAFSYDGDGRGGQFDRPDVTGAQREHHDQRSGREHDRRRGECDVVAGDPGRHRADGRRGAGCSSGSRRAWRGSPARASRRPAGRC